MQGLLGDRLTKRFFKGLRRGAPWGSLKGTEPIADADLEKPADGSGMDQKGSSAGKAEGINLEGDNSLPLQQKVDPEVAAEEAAPSGRRVETGEP